MDWTETTTKAVDTIVTGVDKVTAPVHSAARWVVWGTLGIICALVVFVLICVVAFRALSFVVPVWGAYLILGGIFVICGMFAFTKRKGRS